MFKEKSVGFISTLLLRFPGLDRLLPNQLEIEKEYFKEQEGEKEAVLDSKAAMKEMLSVNISDQIGVQKTKLLHLEQLLEVSKP